MFAAIQKDCDQKPSPVDDNTKLSQIYINFVKKMITYSGKEAIELLGNSHRIWQDLVSAMDAIIEEFSVFIVLRKWAQIHPSKEFSGFCVSKKSECDIFI